MKRTGPVTAAAVLCGLSLAVMVLALCFGGNGAAFTPPPFDRQAQAGSPEVPQELGYQMLDAGVFRVGVCGAVRMHPDGAEVWFTNPADNTLWLRLRIMDESGAVLGQSGIVRPGEYLRLLPLEQTPAEGTAVVMKVMAYEPETYHSAGALTLNTGIGAE